MKKAAARILTSLVTASFLTLPMVAPVSAANSTSLGHGVKCTWVLVSSVNNVNTYKQVCRKGI